MIDFRVYRLAFAPALLAFVALMFSLQGAPAAIEAVTPPAAFDPAGATATAREIAAAAPERRPGSPDDEAIGVLVAERFAEIPAGTVSEQSVSSTFEGDEVDVRNVILTLPGETPATVVVVAGRDTATEAGAAGSAAATGVLIELGAALGVSSHAKTFVLASTSGATTGASGARRLIDGLPDPDAVETVIVLSDLGVADPQPPFVIDSSTGDGTTSAQLVATASEAVSSQLGIDDERPGTVRQLARLAFPSGLGEQAPLIEAGIDSVAISAAGERSVDASAGGSDDASRPTVAGFGRAATSITQTLDVAEQPLEHGPEPYLATGGNLVPGWALALLALALLVPALVAAVDATGWTLRRSGGLVASLGWAGSKALVPLSGLVALYALALTGLVPRPTFPFDPGRFDVDLAAVVATGLIVAAMIAVRALAARPLRRLDVPRSSLVAAAGVTSVAAGLLAWLANPYLGLLIAPAAHAWLVTATGARPLGALVAVAAALLPLALGLSAVAAALELGLEAPWTFLVMVADGQIPFAVALSLCLLAGSLAATVAASSGPLAGRRPSLGS